MISLPSGKGDFTVVKDQTFIIAGQPVSVLESTHPLHRVAISWLTDHHSLIIPLPRGAFWQRSANRKFPQNLTPVFH